MGTIWETRRECVAIRRGAALVESMLRTDRQGAPMPQEAVAHLNKRAVISNRGDLHLANNSRSALERCQLFNLVAARAETLETYGNLYRERGEIERAIEYYERAARAYDEAGISLSRTELLEERALLSLQMGDLGAAQAQIDRLISGRPAEKDELAFFTASLTRGRILTTRGEFERAREDVSLAREIFMARPYTMTPRRGAPSSRYVIFISAMNLRCSSG